MGAGEVGDVDIVADAGAVGRRIIGAEHVEFGPQAERRFDRDLDQMGGALVDCPVRPCGSAPATLKYRRMTYWRSWARPASRSMISLISLDEP